MNKLALVCCLGLAVVGCKKKENAAPPPTPTPTAGSAAGSAAAGSAAAGSAAAGSGSAATDSGSGSGAGAGSAAAAGTVPAADELPAEEAEARKDKKTGLGAPDEKPEVITEELIRKIAAGDVPVKRFIDPKLGVLDWTVQPGAQEKRVPDVKKQRCKDAEAEAQKFFKTVVDRETKEKAADVGTIYCTNEFVTKDDPIFDPSEFDEGKAPKNAVPYKNAACGSSGSAEYDNVYHMVFVPDAERGMRLAAVLATEQGANNTHVFIDLSAALKAAKPCK